MAVDHDELVAADGQRQAWTKLMGRGGRPEVPHDLDRAVDAYARLSADLEWLGARLAGTAGGGRFLTDPIVLVADRLVSLGVGYCKAGATPGTVTSCTAQPVAPCTVNASSTCPIQATFTGSASIHSVMSLERP